VVEDHNVIDEAIREEAEVGLQQNCSEENAAHNFVGIHCVFHPRWRRLQAK
jgi:hypothetical protein